MLLYGFIQVLNNNNWAKIFAIYALTISFTRQILTGSGCYRQTHTRLLNFELDTTWDMLSRLQRFEWAC